MAEQAKGATFDLTLQLKDAGLIAVDDICQVDASDVILDLGAARFDGRVIIDATAVEVASGDESYRIACEFSSSSTFASVVVLGPGQVLGDKSSAAFVNADTDNGAGRYELPFTNEIGGTIYRYMRLSIDITGSIATGINFIAHVTTSV